MVLFLFVFKEIEIVRVEEGDRVGGIVDVQGGVHGGLEDG